MDGTLIFATVEPLVIPAGTLTGTVQAVCQSPGSAGNGFSPGTISALVDPLPFVARVSNIGMTTGGSDRESDEDYRERIGSATAGYSVAGPSSAYEFFARAASLGVVDVTATSPGPAEVLVSILVRDGYDPQDVLKAVESRLNARDTRPLTDLVTVAEAVPVSFDIDLNYYIPFANEAQAVEAIEGPGGTIERYLEWQTGKIGRAINPDYLLMLMITSGALKVDITQPKHLDLTNTEVARLNVKTITHQTINIDGR